jgi:hypothetical protein
VAGVERGYREIAEAADTKLILYLKDEDNLGKEKLKLNDLAAGGEAIN